MGLIYESQLHIQCDNCDYWEATAAMTKAGWAKQLRAQGWRIGKITLCPKCSGKQGDLP